MDAPHAGAAGPKDGPHSRPLTPGDVRSAVFSTTRMRLGYDVEEVDAFLDHVEWTMDQMTAQVELERALREAALPVEWENELRKQLEQAGPDQWPGILEAERRKARAARNVRITVPVTSAPRHPVSL